MVGGVSQVFGVPYDNFCKARASEKGKAIRGILENKYVFTFDHYKLALVYGTCRDGGKPRKNRQEMKKMLVAPVALFLTITLISMTMDVVGYAPGRQASTVQYYSGHWKELIN